MKIRILLNVMLFFCSLILCSEVRAQSYDTFRYFPLDVGDSWVYNLVPAGREVMLEDALEEETLVSAKEDLEGHEVYLFTGKDNEGEMTFYYSKDNDGIYLYKLSCDDTYTLFTPPILFLPRNAELSREYSVSSLAKVYSAAGEIIRENIASLKIYLEGLEDVVVPAGEFKECLKIKFSWLVPMKEGDIVYSETMWMASDVGSVKKLQHREEEANKEESQDYNPKELKNAQINGNKIGGQSFEAQVQELQVQ